MSQHVAVTDHNFSDLSIERDRFESAGYEVLDLQASSPSDIVDGASECVAMLNQYESITRDVFAALDELAVVGRYGIGVDTIDLEVAAEHDVIVVNVPDYCIDEVAEHALALMLSWTRKVPAYDRQTRAGGWDWKEGRPVRRFSDRTIGLIGFGNIPRRVAELLSGFGTDVLAYDPYVDESTMNEYAVEKRSFESILETADIVTIHAPLVEETAHLFDDDAFERMGDDAVLVNTARGGIVDTDALERAIETNAIGGGAIDVFEEEPPAEDLSLRSADDVVITPHVSWYSEGSIVELRESLVDNILAVLEGEEIEDIVTP